MKEHLLEVQNTISCLGSCSSLWGLVLRLSSLSGTGVLRSPGLSRDVSWGIYIAQFTFLVGVAASAVMVVLPYYLHDVKAFGKITILGEFLAIAAVTMCLLFIVVDLGKPMRILNVFSIPTPNSVLFWDMIVLNGYLLLNLLIGWNVLEAERKGTHYPKWVKPLIYLSIPWAVSIHTVTAFLYAGLPARHYWLTAIMAARFLASAFCSGPALLILLVIRGEKILQVRPRQGSHRQTDNDHDLCHADQRFLCRPRVFHGFLQQYSRPYGRPQVPLRRA